MEAQTEVSKAGSVVAAMGNEVVEAAEGDLFLTIGKEVDAAVEARGRGWTEAEARLNCLEPLYQRDHRQASHLQRSDSAL